MSVVNRAVHWYRMNKKKVWRSIRLMNGYCFGWLFGSHIFERDWDIVPMFISAIVLLIAYNSIVYAWHCKK